MNNAGAGVTARSADRLEPRTAPPPAAQAQEQHRRAAPAVCLLHIGETNCQLVVFIDLLVYPISESDGGKFTSDKRTSRG